ncbi:hypothetical protein C8R44DRAFT_821787, partial [Mycena epipterygia]
MHLTPEAAARQAQSEREPLKAHELKEWMSQQEIQEQQDVKTLVELTGGEASDAHAHAHALNILRKHHGDMQKAADVLLKNVADDPEERIREASLASIKEDFGHLFPGAKSRAVEAPRGNVIDLTGDDDPTPDASRFRATTRSPDPSWQMVRTDHSMDTGKSADDELNEVIQASYNDFAADESDTIPTEEMTVREGGRPIALRADVPGKAYAALVIQCLFHVPQVRQRCSKLHLHLVDGEPPLTNPDRAIWTLIEMFTAMDLGQISVFCDIDLFNSWDTVSLTQGLSVGTLSKQFIERVANLLQSDLDQQRIEQAPNLNRLFHFTYCRVHSPVTGPPETIYEDNVGHVVGIEINPDSPSNELVARLSQTLNTYHDDGSSDHQLILQPSEMVTFEITVNASSSTGTSSPEPLVYPKCIYMDQFLAVNLDLANETRTSQRQIQKEIETLTATKKKLTRFEDQDTFENLRGTIEYYEHTASPERPEALKKTMATKLRTLLQKMESEVEAIDQKVSDLQTELDGLWINPELQCHPYDLRAVLVHTGLPGRKHIYSYVHEKGTWWKTVDYTVTEVPEDLVMSDPAGLHLGAGPYMLIYSRRQSELEMRAPVEWPPLFAENIMKNNVQFINEQAAAARNAGAKVESRDEDAMDL